MSFGSASVESNERELRAEMAEESPERALVADIATAETSYALERAISKVESLDAESGLTQEQIDGLKGEVNSRQLKLLEETLSAHSNEEGYNFNTPSDLERVQKLITMNPNMEGVDKEQYDSLWQEKLEPRAVELFIERIGRENTPSDLEATRKRVEGYSFTDEAKRGEILSALDERSTEYFIERIGRENTPSDLEATRKRVEGYSFTDEAKKAELLAQIEEKTSGLRAT